jgi:hypothetical protein
MSNLSLARIMYGTNEDFHGPRPVKKPGLSAIAIPMAANRLAAWEPPTVQELLDIAWKKMTRKA